MKDLTSKNIYLTFLGFGVPLVLSGLLSQAYGIIDTMIAGKFLGEQGLSAIGSTSPLITLISSLFWGFGVGFSIYIAKLFGEGKYKKIKSAVFAEFVITAVFALILCGTLILFYKPVFSLLNVEEEITKPAFEYFAIYMGGYVFLMLGANVVYLLNAFGIGTFPFVVSLISAVLNVGGNLLCVVLLGWGVKGLALSSVFSGFVVLFAYIYKLKKCFKEIGVNDEKPRFKEAGLKESFPYAFPNMCQQLVMYLSGLLLSPLVNRIGISATASYSVILRIYDILGAVYQNSSKAVSNFSAQCIGHQKYERLKKGVWAGFIQGMLLTTPFVLACVLFSKPVCSLFFKADTDAEAQAYAVLFAKTYVPFIYLSVVCNLFHAFYRGTKATAFLFSSTLVGSFVRYVSSAVLIGKFGMEGFLIGWVISWGVEALFSFCLFLTARWTPTKKAT